MNVSVSTEVTTYLREEDEADLPTALLDQSKLEAIIDRVKTQAKAALPEVLDISKSGHQALLRSAAYKIRQSKSAIDKAALALTEDYRAKTAKINAVRKYGTATIEEFHDEFRRPLTEEEEREKAAAAELQAQLDAIAVPNTLAVMTAEQIAGWITLFDGINPDDGSWPKVEEVARHKKSEALAALCSARDAAVKRERDAAELEKLRAEAAERARNDALAAAAVRKAEREENERKAREEAAQRAADAARLQAEREAAEKVEAAQRAQREAEEARERAVQEERDRSAAEKRLQELAAAARADNARIRTRALGRLANSISSLLSDIEITPDQRDQVTMVIAKAIADGKLPCTEFKP
jgi:hypothetical protein